MLLLVQWRLCNGVTSQCTWTQYNSSGLVRGMCYSLRVCLNWKTKLFIWNYLWKTDTCQIVWSLGNLQVHFATLDIYLHVMHCFFVNGAIKCHIANCILSVHQFVSNTIKMCVWFSHISANVVWERFWNYFSVPKVQSENVFSLSRDV